MVSHVARSTKSLNSRHALGLYAVLVALFELFVTINQFVNLLFNDISGTQRHFLELITRPSDGRSVEARPALV